MSGVERTHALANIRKKAGRTECSARFISKKCSELDKSLPFALMPPIEIYFCVVAENHYAVDSILFVFQFRSNL